MLILSLAKCPGACAATSLFMASAWPVQNCLHFLADLIFACGIVCLFNSWISCARMDCAADTSAYDHMSKKMFSFICLFLHTDIWIWFLFALATTKWKKTKHCCFKLHFALVAHKLIGQALCFSMSEDLNLCDSLQLTCMEKHVWDEMSLSSWWCCTCSCIACHAGHLRSSSIYVAVTLQLSQIWYLNFRLCWTWFW